MPEIENAPDLELTALTADIVAAYVGNHQLIPAALGLLIGDVYSTIANLVKGPSDSAPEVEKQLPAVSIKKSVTVDYIICLEDGRKFKSLRRHLSAIYKLSPEQYRAKWGLPADYPMVAPGYSEKRKALAVSFGLGKKRDGFKYTVAVENAAPEVTSIQAKLGRGRPEKIKS